MKDKRGFTLTELLAVIVILGIIALIAIPSSFAISNRIKIKLYCTKLETISKAAELYASDHYDEVNLGMITKVSVKDLVDYGYLKKDKDIKIDGVYVVDPKDDKTPLDDQTFTLKISNSRAKVSYDEEAYYYLCGDNKLKDKKKPNCLYKGESTTWTNEPRTITVSCYDTGSGCKTKDEVLTYRSTQKHDSVRYHIKDWLGNSETCSKDLDVYVDTTDPTYEIKGEAANSNDWSNKRTITVKCIDHDSGCVTEDIKYEYGLIASDNDKRNVETDTITFTIEDRAGNKKTVTKEINVYTDIDNPTCSYSGESTTWSKESRSVQIICNDTMSGCKTASKSITISSSQELQELNFIAEDQAGNQTDCTKNLNIYVDTVKPTASITNITNNVDNKQTVKLAMNDDMGVKEYYFGTTNPNNSGITWTKYTENNVSKTISDAGTYYLTVKDQAGNLATDSKVFYKTTLDPNGGSVTPTSIITLSGNTYNIPNAARNYYTFNGWYTQKSGGTKQSTSYKPTGSTTLYAQWAPVNYGITYNTNNSKCPNGSSGNPTSYNVETANFTLKNPTCTGYTFNGWSGTGLSGSTNTSVTVAKGSTGNRSYTANWTINNYTLDVNGLLDGTAAGNTTNYGTFDVYINGSIVANDVSDYYTSHPYGTSYEIKDIKATTGHIYNGVSSGSAKATIGTANVGVQLKYTTKTVTVTFKSNGPGAADKTQTFKYGVANQSFNSDFSWNGYTQGGWAESASGAAVYSKNSGVSNDWINSKYPSTTLYATWTKNCSNQVILNNASGNNYEMHGLWDSTKEVDLGTMDTSKYGSVTIKFKLTRFNEYTGTGSGCNPGRELYLTVGSQQALLAGTTKFIDDGSCPDQTYLYTLGVAGYCNPNGHNCAGGCNETPRTNSPNCKAGHGNDYNWNDITYTFTGISNNGSQAVKLKAHSSFFLDDMDVRVYNVTLNCR